MQEECFAWQQKYNRDTEIRSWPSADCQEPTPSSSCWVCSPVMTLHSAACSAGSASTQPQCSCLPFGLCIYPFLSKGVVADSRVVACSSSLWHRYSIEAGHFILWVLPTLDFVLQCLFSEVLKRISALIWLVELPLSNDNIMLLICHSM